MKNLLKLITLILFFAIPGSSKAFFIHRQFTLQFYGTYNCEIYIPNNTTGVLPAVIFIPGSGESNTNVNGLYVNGPLRFIRDAGWQPNFIVVGIQPLNGGPGSWQFVDNALDSLFANPAYRINQSKWYLTGLSYGAAAIFNYFIQTPANQFRSPAAIVPFSITTNCQCGDFYANTDYLCGTDFRFQSVPSWGFAGTADSHWEKMHRFFVRMQQAGWNARWTSYAGGHCCWNTYYTPSYVENINGVNMSIYQWMLQYQVASVALPVSWGYFNYYSPLQQLQWSTETEINNDHFEVQESEDGVNWKTIAMVNSKSPDGNSSTTLEYSYILN